MNGQPFIMEFVPHFDVSSFRDTREPIIVAHEMLVYVVDKQARSGLVGCFTNCYVGMRLKLKSTVTFTSDNLLVSIMDETDGVSLADQIGQLTSSFADSPQTSPV